MYILDITMFLTFYRFYIALLAGAAVIFRVSPKLWLCFVIIVAVRTIWFFVEQFIRTRHQPLL